MTALTVEVQSLMFTVVSGEKKQSEISDYFNKILAIHKMSFDKLFTCQSVLSYFFSVLYMYKNIFNKAFMNFIYIFHMYSCFLLCHVFANLWLDAVILAKLLFSV